MIPVHRVQRMETRVMFLAVKDLSDEIGRGWDRLESALGSIRGRRFFGAFDDSGVYRCCVQIREDDAPEDLGLSSGVLPGGSFLRATVLGSQPAAYGLLAPTFETMQQAAPRDWTRPTLEYYRRHDRIDVLMPVSD